MRWIILALIFVNLGYFALGSFRASQSSYQIKSERPTEVAGVSKRLVLLSESLPATLDQRIKNPVIITDKTQINDNDQQCLALGPFMNSDVVDQVQQRLFSMGVESRERTNNVARTADYWVHIPPMTSRDAAIRLLRELQSQKIDSFVITQGELTNGISLGLFSNYDSAKAVRRRLVNAGYPVEIEKLVLQPESWWLELDSGEEEKLDSNFWSELIERVPAIKKTKKSCGGIASATEFL